MDIHVLGSGAYPLSLNEGKSLSLFFPDFSLVIDAGIGLTALPKEFSTDKLTILLSHYHHDHILGLPFLANILERGKIKSIEILGDERITQLAQFFQEPFNPSYTSEQMPVTMNFLPEKYVLNSITIRRKQVPHASGMSNYFTISDGRSLAAIGTDTTADTQSASFFENADVLFHECNFDNTNKKRAIAEGHSYPDAVTALALSAHVKTLLLIHTDPRLADIEKEVQSKFPNSRAVQDGEIITS